MKTYAVLSLALLGLCIKRSTALPYSEFHKNGIRGATLQTSPDGTCGGENGYICLGSGYGDCCSPSGQCGSTYAYCNNDAGCQAGFGKCSPGRDSTTTRRKLKAKRDNHNTNGAGSPSKTPLDYLSGVVPRSIPSTLSVASIKMRTAVAAMMPDFELPSLPGISANEAPSKRTDPNLGIYPCGEIAGCSTGNDFISQSLEVSSVADCKKLCDQDGGCKLFSFGSRTDDANGHFCNLYGGTFADDYRQGTSKNPGCTTSKWYDAKCSV